MYVYIYIYVCVYIYMYVYIYIYTHIFLLRFKEIISKSSFGDNNKKLLSGYAGTVLWK